MQAEAAFQSVKASDLGLVCACLAAIIPSSPEEGVRTMAAVLLRQIISEREKWLALAPAVQAAVTDNVVAR